MGLLRCGLVSGVLATAGDSLEARGVGTGQGRFVPDSSGGATPWVLAAAGTTTGVEHVDVAKASALLLANTNIVVLDVRTPREFRGGHIGGATNINFNADGFADAVKKLDRDKAYLVHCAAGGRSTKSLEVFRKLGFKTILHLDGGFTAWEEAGKPVVR